MRLGRPVRERLPAIDDDAWAPAFPVFDERLTTGDAAPLAVAFSGGGDSLALLLAAKTWADAHGRSILALTVDHRLRPAGADWARWCAARAGRLDVAHRTLVWAGEKPATGLSAAARLARHRLLADAAREGGAAVVLMGHTADDRAEAASMREAGSNTPSPRVWSPSPVWPEGRGLFLLRPLLEIGRAALRRSLEARGETWIEDPANGDPGSARAQARARLGASPLGSAGQATSNHHRAAAPLSAPTARVRRPCPREGPAGSLWLPRAAFDGDEDAAGDEDVLGDLGAALLCAAGTGRPPRTEALRRLRDRIVAGQAFVATLAGARVESDGDGALIVRDAGDRRRGVWTGAPGVDRGDVDLPIHRPVAWDGRFEIAAAVAGARVGALAGRAGRLTPPLRRAVLELPPAARPTLPLVMLECGDAALPTLIPTPLARARSLVLPRFMAARRGIVNEAALRRMAKPAAAS